MEPSPTVQIVFWLMTLCAIGGGVGVVASRNLFHSALYLIVSLFGVAGYYVLLSAGFLAVVQLIVYIGAISILILFAIMFSRRVMDISLGQANHQWWLSLPATLLLFIMLLFMVNTVDWPVSEAELTDNSILQLGLAFLGNYLIPFEVIGILLSVALVGAVILAREKTKEEIN